MSTNLLIILLFGFAAARVGSKPPSSFRRASVESVPHWATAFFQNYGSTVDGGKVLDASLYDSISFPNNRYAVEKAPTKEQRAEEHFPIRDAVEKVPPISEYLENFRTNTLQKQTAPEETMYRVVCFLPNWSYHRTGGTKFTPDYADPNLCTHIIYAYAALNPENYTIVVSDSVVDLDNGYYRKVTSTEITAVSNVLISIGGWTDSAGDKYSKLVSSGSNRRRFVNSVIAFLRRYNFRGLHVDWQYPVCWQARCSKDRASDKNNFVKLIQELREEFNKHQPPYVLAVGLSGYTEIINEAYDVLSLNENVDFLTVTTYDYHGAWENRTGHPSPLYSDSENLRSEYSVHSSMTTLVMKGADPKKLVLGVALYGQSFTIADAARHEIGDESLEPGEPGEFTQQPGILSYAEICTRTTKQGWKSARNPQTGTDSYAFKDNQWVGYDDKVSLRKKINYMKKSGYGGVMAWTLDLDDFNNECCTGVYPLLQEINVAIGRLPPRSGALDCSKPVIVPLDSDTNSSEMTTTTGVESEAEFTESTRPCTSTRYTTRPPWTTTTAKYSTTRPWSTTKYPTRPWSTTKYPTYRPTSTQLSTSSQWWPPHLTDRPSAKPKPKPQPQPQPQPPLKSTTKAVQTTKRPHTPASTHWTTATPFHEFPVVSENEADNDAEETTPPAPQGYHCVDGKYYHDPSNCNSYFMCVFGQKMKNQCPPGLHWNHKMQICDWPSKATCWEPLIKTTYAPSSTGSTWPWAPTHSTEGVSQWWPPVISSRPTYHPRPSKSTVESSAPSSTTTKMTTVSQTHEYSSPPPYSSEEIEPEVKPSAANKIECENGKYYRDPNDCGVYYLCVFGRKKKHNCPSGLHFNTKTENCDWPSRATCQDPSSGPEETTPTSSTNSAENPEHSSSSPSTPWWTWTEKPSTTTKSPSSTTTTKQTWWTWTETPWSESTSSGTQSTPTTSSSAWWTWSETPSTSWEWTPSTTTAATLPTTKPPQPISGRYKVVCYFTNWAWYRPGSGKYLPEDTDPNLCTHVVYGFTVLDTETLTIRIHDSWADVDNKFFERVAALKKRGVRVTVAVGGWNDSAGDKYSRLVNNPTARANFISSILRFMNKYGFEGLDLDWEYPKCWQTNCDKGPDSDKEAFSALVTELREAFDPHNFLLSAAVSPSKLIIDKGYDVPLLSQKLDWIAVMTYDFHGQWDKKTGHVAPIYHIPGDDNEYFNAYYALNYWIKNGADPRKIVMGMPMYGQGFTLSNRAENSLNAPASGPSQAGSYTRSAGFLAYYEICQKIRDEQWTVVQDAQGRRGPYAYKGDQWVGYDDIHAITIKINLIKKLGLGGGMIWALDLDDFRNVCGDGHYPLLTTIARGLSHSNTDYEIDTSYVTGVSIPWSSPETSTVSTSFVTRTTKRISSRHPTRFTKSTTSATTSTSTAPSTPSTTVSGGEFSEFTEDNDVEGGNEWSSSSTTSVTNAEPSTPGERFKVVCYFTNWAWYRQGKGKYMVHDIDSSLCTHIIYAFAVLDSGKLTIKPHDSWADIDNQFYEKFVELKKRGVKVLLAIGGWNDSAGNKYSRLVNSKSARSSFVSHVVQFLKKYNFDGLDVDWEYPKCWQVNCKLGPASDKKAFADFISELREVFDEHGLLLSAAVSPNRKVIDAGYDVPLLSEKLDWISVMVYDYHGQWDEVTGHVAPMYEHPDDADKLFNANASLHYWVQKGANPRKIIMGMPMYGQSFTLASSKNSSLNSRAYGGGEAGESTRARGFLAYYEICERILRKGWDVEYDVKGRMGPYAKRGNQWVSFDDQAMIRHKSQYVLYNNLGGAMIWALDLDDFKNVCDCGTYPLLKTINKVLRNYQGDVPECSLESSAPTDMKLFYQNEGADLFNEHWKFETCEHGEVKKHPTDCTKYLTCAYGVYLQERSCAIGLHFNEKRSTCDWPENAECKPTIMEYAEQYFLKNLQKQSLVSTVRKSDPKKYKVVCYLTNWSAYRYNNQLFPVQALDNHLCTHIIYGFVMLDPQTLTIRSNDTFKKLDEDFFKRVRVLKETGVKISLALGGWYDSQENKYSRLVSSKAARAQFIKHAVKFLTEHDFDGLEVDWEYPRCWQVDCSRGPVSDKNGFVTLLRELKESFWKNDLLLSIAVSTSREIIDQAYEVPEIFSYVDWLSLMAYDYHGFWEGKTDHIAPLYQSSSTNSDDLTVDSSISYWLDKGAPPEKLILGIPFYGQSFTLKNTTNNKVGSKVIGPGNPGRHTRVPGFLAFYEICEMTSQGNWKTVKDKNGHYTYMQDQWISYNDVSDIRSKGKYIKENRLGGALVWSLDLDDFVNVCGCGPNPLLFAINDELSEISHRTANTVENCT